MKTIGLVGGMSWESTAHYYALINKMVNERLGGHHSAKLLLYSIDFEELTQRTFADKWDEAAAIMVDAAKRLERGGADFVLICANTMHIAAEEVEQAIGIPLLHIADATAERIIARDIRRVGLLGTAFTMEREFYTSRLRDKFGLAVMLPCPAHRKLLHRVIVDELVYGVVNPESKAKLREVIAELIASGAEGIILGCTELMMILEQADSAVPMFDTTTIHSEAAVEHALACTAAV
ncbi:MAG TPA: aspartate/glutamate racemase family protein [Clostridia bacterium]|nr:aspartate/glutamate racemase family protein [Clostridia bacterium]